MLSRRKLSDEKKLFFTYINQICLHLRIKKTNDYYVMYYNAWKYFMIKVITVIFLISKLQKYVLKGNGKKNSIFIYVWQHYVIYTTRI